MRARAIDRRVAVDASPACARGAASFDATARDRDVGVRCRV